MPRRRVLVIAFSDLASDPRVDRQIRHLAGWHDVTAAGHGDPRVDGVAYVPLHPATKPLSRRLLGGARLLLRDYDRYYRAKSEVEDARRRLASLAPEVVVANDVDTLPLAVDLAPPGRVLFDAHEYAPLEFEDRLFFRLFLKGYRTHLCRRWIPRVGAMTTVCGAIADRYAAETGIRAEVIWNAPEHAADLAPSPPDPGGTVRLVHHGAAIRSRRIEAMIRAVRRLPERFTLDLFLTGPDRRYRALLRREAGGDPRIRFRDPVPMRTLPRTLNGYDVGVFLLEPVNFNYRHALPNKIFEFVQARLAVAIGPSPEMASLVRTHDLGTVARDFRPETLAASILALEPRIGAHKARAHAAAPALSAEPGGRTLLALVDRLGGAA